MQSGAFILSPAATSPALTQLDGAEKSDENPGTLWRTAPPDSLQGQVAAADMLGRGTSRVGLIYEDGAYGLGLAEIFQAEFTGGGGSVQSYAYSTDNQLTEAIGAVQVDDQLDEVFFISSTIEGVGVFMQAAQLLGFEGPEPGPDDDKRIFLSDGAAQGQFFEVTEGAWDVYDQVRGTRPSVDESTLNYSTFATSYLTAYGEDPSGSIYTAYAYDAGWLAVYALAWSHYQQGEITPKGMGAGMRQLTDKSGGRLLDVRPSSWNDVKAYFQLGQGIDVNGVSGSLDYDPETEETTAPIQVWVIVGTEEADFEVVHTVEP